MDDLIDLLDMNFGYVDECPSSYLAEQKEPQMEHCAMACRECDYKKNMERLFDMHWLCAKDCPLQNGASVKEYVFNEKEEQKK